MNATADDIWDVLVEHAGASDNETNRSSFRVFYAERHARTTVNEFRLIGGSLGFGGKVWFLRRLDGWHWDVNCYRTDETPERLAAIERTNVILEQFTEPVP